MAQNSIIVVYALLPAGAAQEPLAGQTYHLPPFTLVGEYSHRRPNCESISPHKLAMGVPHHPINKPPPEYLYWRDAVKDQMLARGYISDNWHFPDAEFQQIVEGIKRLKPACDELATASAANNMASMQEIDEAVLQLVKECGKKLANTIRTNNQVPPRGPGVPPAQVIVRPMLLPLNAPPQCQWSIATSVVPHTGPVGQKAPLANAPGLAQNVPAPPPGAQAVPAPPANPQAPNIASPPGPADPEAQHDPPPPGLANPQRRIGLRLGNLYGQTNAHQPANIPGQIQSGPSMGILGTPLGIKHAPANPPGPINLPGPEDRAVQTQADPPTSILGRPMGMRHGPLADILEAVAPNVEDPLIESFDVALRVRRIVSGLSQISQFFWQRSGFVVFELRDLGDIDWSALLGRPHAVRIVWVSQPANSSAPRRNYRLLHWRNPHINGVRFAELNSYDIRGLSAIILRTVPHNMIRYILGATGEGWQQLRLPPGAQLAYIDYVSIENDEDIRGWLLSNPVLDDPSDLLVTCHRAETRGRLPTPPLRGHNYLRENAIANWARTAASGNCIQAARSDARTDPGPSNAGGEQKQRDDSPLFLPRLSSSSSDVSDAEEGYQASIGASPYPVAGRSKTQTQSKINIQKVSRLSIRRGDTEYHNVRKRGAPSHEEDSEYLSKKASQASYALAWLKGKADGNVQAEPDEQKGHEEERGIEIVGGV